MKSEVKSCNADVVLKSKWGFLHIKDKKNKTKVFVDKLYIDADKIKNDFETVNYYNDLVSEEKSKPYALVRAILASKNITGIEFCGNYEKMTFKREPEFFMKKPTLRINLKSNDIKKYADIIKENSITNYVVSRDEFLESSFKDENVVYYFHTQTYKASYDKKILKNKLEYNFKLVDAFDNGCLFNDESFLRYALQSISEISTTEISYEYKKTYFELGKPDYFVHSMKMHVDNKVINIDYLSSDLFEEIVQLIKEHNSKIDTVYSKKYEFKGEKENE